MTKPHLDRAALVTPHWLQDRLLTDHADLVVLDASVGPLRNVDTGIPGARRFDIDGELSRSDVDLPHTMVPPEQFQSLVRSLGVHEQSVVVVYDAAGIYSSARAWWMFRAMGHSSVAVLDGGLPGWIAAGFPVEPLTTSATRNGDFVARPDPSAFVDLGQVAAHLHDPSVVVLDARSSERFLGTAPEPRPGLRSGHVPGSRSLPLADLVIDGRLLPPAELASLMHESVGESDRVVATCGSGVTACVIALAAHLTGVREVSVYDGSWSEWGRPDGPPICDPSSTR